MCDCSKQIDARREVISEVALTDTRHRGDAWLRETGKTMLSQNSEPGLDDV
jgi:hypothetical protein